MTDAFDFLPDGWSYLEKDLWTDGMADNPQAFYDPVAQALYNEAFFNWDAREGEVTALRGALEEYLASEYGIDFDAGFDWDAWREAYDAA